MPLNTDSIRNGSQYQHYVPQFILRRFRIQKHTSQKNTVARSLPQSEPQGKSVLLYDMSTRSMKACSTARVFGKQDLYRDTRDANPNHIEQAFAHLEGKTSIIVDNIHGAMVSPDKIFETTRKDLSVLRKFLFLQSYRTSHQAISYQMGAHEPLRDWIAQSKLEKGLHDDVDAWKDYMDYLLETPHEVLVKKAEVTIKRLGQETVDAMRRTVVDPEVNWLDIEYALFSKDYYMSICVASPDSEFILSENSFGLGEGFKNNGDRLHKVYVLSPRIAIILRLLDFDDPLPSITGVLASIRMERCSVKFAGFDTELYSDDTVDQMFQEYRTSAAASRDVYTFKLVELTLEETQAVNGVVLYNLTKQSILTFASRTHMFDTLNAYRISHRVDSRRFDALFGILKEMCQKIPKPEPAPVVLPPQFLDVDSELRYSPPPIEPKPFEKVVVENTFEAILQAAMTPLGLPDSYSRAATIYDAAISTTIPHPIAFIIIKLTSDSIIEFGSGLIPVPHLILQYYRRTLRMVDEVPKQAFDYFVHFIEYNRGYLAVSMGSVEAFQVVIRAAAVGLIQWLVQHRPDALKVYGVVRQ